MYQRNRNIVPRPDGRLVNVVRPRGQLFVCSGNCCCGRTEDGFAPVPVELYHGEWERRRLRNIVHLTIGGCLGPCALANVALLLFDGQALWFHSLNGDSQIVALYDYIEAMLDADAVLPPPPALAPCQFTASSWQPRPDGQPVDDFHRRRSAAGARPACELPPSCDTPEPSAADRAVADMDGATAMPRKNGELVFAAPWEGRAFGMAVALHEDDAYAWDEFRDRLIATIAGADAAGDPSTYYERWLASFETLLVAKGIVTPDELEARTAEFEFGERDEVF